ncbi:type II secretion system F family protein [Candidatus Peregrinibacteria bacterium]|nr:MAG: type II secretion system F family protein [Candidatus Peregrinibacteria bacterium]
MNVDNPNTTRLDIGLSREDQERIENLRTVNLDKKSRNPSTFFKQLNDAVIGWTKISLREKVTFFQLLAVMINAGMPIIRSLYVLADQLKNLKLKVVIRKLALEMEEGKSLSQAMESHPSVFSAADRGMVASGEASGNLNAILNDIAHQSEKSAMIISKVRGAMIYPAAILIIMGLCLFLILTMVVPKLTDLFTSSGKALPTSTNLLLKTSAWAQEYWLAVLLLFLAFMLGLILMHQTKKGRYSIDLVLLRLPIFGKLIRELMISRFARMLASLMKAGVPIVRALEIDSNALGNTVYQQRVNFASQDVAQGIPLGENLSGSDFLFPPMVASMVLVGEQTANLSEVCGKIADYYEEEVDNAVASLSKLMEPVILVVMGGMVGFIVAAIMQPIISLSDISSSI